MTANEHYQVFIPPKYQGRAFLKRKECADVSGLSVSLFDRLAWKKEGPPFVKASERSPALYPVPEFFQWLATLRLQGGSMDA